MREDWIEVELGEVCSIISGYAFKKSEYSEKGVRLFQIANVSFNESSWEKIAYLPENYLEKKEYQQLILSDGDIVMALNRPMLQNKLKITQLSSNDTPAILYQRVGKFKIKKTIYPKIFLYYLQSPIFIKWLSDELQGVNIPFINQSKLLSYEVFPLFPLPIQRAIVLKIENLFASLDKGIADLKTAQEQLKVYRQAVLKKAFEGKLVSNHDSKDSPDNLDLKNEGKENHVYQENQKNQGSDNVPAGWKWVKLGEVAEVNPKLPNKEGINSSLEVQFLPMKLVEEEINKIHLIETKLFHEVQKGSYTPFIENDIIFAKVTPCMENGKIAITNNLKNGIGYGSSEFHVIRCIGEILNTYIFHYVVQSRFRKEAENQMTGAVGLRRVPKKFLEDYLIPLPPTLAEQHAIVREIESRLSVCDKVEQSIAEALEKAEALRQSILKKAFEGKLLSEAEIAKCKQEADYEPAAKLLERIKNEKQINDTVG